MKVHKVETVTRYHVTFEPHETKVLRAHPKWQRIVSIAGSRDNVRQRAGVVFGAAMLTKKQINEICDVLGVNGREFMARALDSLPVQHG